MPMIWRREENPYRFSYFSLLEVGPDTDTHVIASIASNMLRKIRGGASHSVGGRQLSEAVVSEAESRLLEMPSWAEEILMVHHAPAFEGKHLRKICRDIRDLAKPPAQTGNLELTDLSALLSILPMPSEEDIPWPDWAELGIKGAESEEDSILDIQFDL